MGDLERVTVNLNKRAAEEARSSMDLTGDSKTDVINRALPLYEMVTKIQQAGGSVYVREDPQAELIQLRLL